MVVGFIEMDWFLRMIDEIPVSLLGVDEIRKTIDKIPGEGILLVMSQNWGDK
jgi:hypothetical protein